MKNFKPKSAWFTTLNFRPFSRQDWDCFNGCESALPMIAEFGDEGYVILDGEYLEIGLEYGDMPVFMGRVESEFGTYKFVEM